MTTDQNNLNNQKKQDLLSKLGELLEEAKSVSREIDETNRRANEELDQIGARVDNSVNKIEQIFSELDKIENDACDELDKLMLQHSEDLASEQ